MGDSSSDQAGRHGTPRSHTDANEREMVMQRRAYQPWREDMQRLPDWTADRKSVGVDVRDTQQRGASVDRIRQSQCFQCAADAGPKQRQEQRGSVIQAKPRREPNNASKQKRKCPADVPPSWPQYLAPSKSGRYVQY